MSRRRSPRKLSVPFLSAMFGLVVCVLPAHAQPPPANPNEMCGTGETFTVELEGKTLGIDETDGWFRTIAVPAVARPDRVTLPKGCRIYAFLISGFGDNEGYDRIIFYKVAEFVARNNGYVHVGWWNNLTSEYMGRPLHPETITIQRVIPILGIPIGQPTVIHPTPQTHGIPDTFVNTSLDLPKANPDDDFQFQSDASAVLRAVRLHNPGALILVIGHSMGGAAVARLAANPAVSIDLLAPIDPVGNRDLPVGEVGQRTLNWTRWRAASVFNGYKQWDCVRNFLNLCDADPRPFAISIECVKTSGWLDVKPSSGSIVPAPFCQRPVYVDPGTRLNIGANVKYLYHRYQQEFLWPVDYPSAVHFERPRQFPQSNSNIFSRNYQAPVDTCFSGTDPIDSSFDCSPIEGHGELVGVRTDGPGNRVRPGLQLTNWPARSSTFTPGDRRDRLIQLAVDGPAFPYRPQNPDLCLVCDDIIAITQRLMDEQVDETPVDRVPPESIVSQEPDANAHGWVNEGVVVSVGASDARSGVQAVEVTMSGAQEGSIITPGASSQVTINMEGLTTVSYFARDLAGNAGEIRTLDVRIDRTPPKIVALTDTAINDQGWIGAPTVVSFEASDDAGGSGLATSSADVAVGTEGADQIVSGSAEDNAGNFSEAAITLNIDLTPPGIALEGRGPAANAAGWNNTPVTVKWQCNDSLSGVVAPLDAVVLGDEGAAQSATGTCRDRADHLATNTVVGIKIDTTEPSVNISLPADQAVFLLNARVRSAYECGDNLSGVKSCAGPAPSGSRVSTSSVGKKHFKVSSRDAAGNTTSSATAYSVRYAFSGFAAPILPMPMRNVVKAGSTVPIKYFLRDANGAFVSERAAFVALTSVTAACEAKASAGSGKGGESIELDGKGKHRHPAWKRGHRNWQTQKAWAGTCRVMQLELNDGTMHTALFQFK